jgi:hypothetical protein
VLAGNAQLTGIVWKLHTTGMHLLSETGMFSRFSWGKQINKTKKYPVLAFIFEWLALLFSYCV